MSETSGGSEDQHQRVLDQLARHVDTTSGGSSRHKPVHFISDTWRRWLEGTEVEHISSRVLNELHDGSVDRSQISEFAHRAKDADGRLRLLLATLIWGRGPPPKDRVQPPDQLSKSEAGRVPCSESLHLLLDRGQGLVLLDRGQGLVGDEGVDAGPLARAGLRCTPKPRIAVGAADEGGRLQTAVRQSAPRLKVVGNVVTASGHFVNLALRSEWFNQALVSQLV